MMSTPQYNGGIQFGFLTLVYHRVCNVDLRVVQVVCSLCQSTRVVEGPAATTLAASTVPSIQSDR
jgi:hypothetical protein